MHCECNSEGSGEVRSHYREITGFGADRKGITLSELLIVIVIVAIMAAMSVPDLSRSYGKRGFYSQKDELCAVVRRARDRAVERGLPWRIVFSPEKKSWYCYEDRNTNNRMDPGEERMGPYHLDPGISFSSHARSGPNRTEVPADGISLADNKVKFSPMGTCNAGTIFLACGKWDLAVRIYPASGSIRTFEYRSEWHELR